MVPPSPSRRQFLSTLSLSTGALALHPLLARSQSLPPSRPPNVILILADDLGYECLGANGSTQYQTPHLDALAASGVRFNHCYSQPLCTPSRAQILTGRYNFRNYRGFGFLPKSEVTLAHHLRAAGYATAVTGKWQLGLGKRGPKRTGFTEYSLWHLLSKRRTPKGSRYAAPKIHQNGDLLPDTAGLYGPDLTHAFARDFITRNKEKPFFLLYSMMLPHSPFTPTPDLPEWRTAPETESVQFFPHMVRYMDGLIGNLVEHLRSLNLDSNTLLLFTGDNGCDPLISSQFQGRTVRGGKGLPYATGTHVPLIASWPGRAVPGRVDNDLIDFSDFVPTILEATGVPQAKPQPIDGLSFLPRIEGRQNAPRPWVYSYYKPLKRKWPFDLRWAHNREFKLYGDNRFYNIANDPQESRPIAVTAANRDTYNGLQYVINYYRSIGG